MLLQFTGYLKELHPNGIKVAAKTVYDAIYALRFYEGFKLNGTKKHIVIAGFNTLELLHSECDPQMEITIHPFLGGAGGGKKGAFTQILIGAAFIALAVMNPAFAAATATNPVGSMFAYRSLIMNIGLNLVLGGAMQLLQKTPKAQNAALAGGSRILGATSNTTQIGTPIPIILGTYRWHGHFLSFNVDAKDYDPRA